MFEITIEKIEEAHFEIHHKAGGMPIALQEKICSGDRK